ncbi:sugar ABC transporter ATP-binding protein [Rhodocytophaga aerolata]|uniref:Sugar ABC transporter ATP-binding protein n=1 Tax=Rhodocytophaga aerolata TaxID=455078 RepID=A0ABT8R071_9BACT|nr:sugar ABC transporter ATP-binding protein [Rhodocytophaga aerolata]MDO1445492.1 sugar ABC transporter ATP-binding protein [Rhodocytophaga aerolata]
MDSAQEYILQVQNLSKSFAGVKALDQVQLKVKRGEVHALMGENGAGKSTFMKILIGMHTADSGEIIFEGQPILSKHSHTQAALKKGIAMIHQELLLVPQMTVAQNLFLGKETITWFPWWVNDKRIHQQATALLQKIGLDIDPQKKLKRLRVAEMQMVEIAKAISNEAKIIIMDEPTSAISDKEVETLFSIITDLKKKGVAIIYISHKMDEIFTIADTITVLRDGKYIDTKPASQLNSQTLISMMVGRQLTTVFPQAAHTKGEIMLSVKELHRKHTFSHITFDVHKGEVLGIAGLMGAGRTEVARAICGLDPVDRGEMYVKGKKVRIDSTKEAFAQGIGYVSEDRKGVGLVPGMSVKQNITLASLEKYSKGWFVNETSESAVVSKMIDELRIKTAGLDQPVKYLSGGNQQKVVIGKVLLSSPDIIILDEPTRGIDVGAKAEIYKLIHQLTAKGIAIILISSELPEVLGLSDRILVMAKGRQRAIIPKAEATQEKIMKYAMEQ